MSNYFLCDRCANKFGEHGTPTATTSCVPFPLAHRKRVMYDHGGVDGIRYRDPLEVCPYYREWRNPNER